MALGFISRGVTHGLDLTTTGSPRAVNVTDRSVTAPSYEQLLARLVAQERMIPGGVAGSAGRGWVGAAAGRLLVARRFTRKPGALSLVSAPELEARQPLRPLAAVLK